MRGAPQEQRQRAWAAVATIVGAVTVVRALPPGEEARAVLDAAFAAVTEQIPDRTGAAVVDRGRAQM